MAALVFVVAALALTAGLFLVAVGVRRMEATTLERLADRTAVVKVWGGWVLVAVGLWFLVLAAFADVFVDVFPV